LTAAARYKAADAVLSFWFEETKPAQHFKRDDGFDDLVRARFGALHEQAAKGVHDGWMDNARSSLALIITLDQFSRNIYRDDARAFATDAKALTCAREAIAKDFDLKFPPNQQAFFLMPFMHAEDLTVQEESVALFRDRQPGADNLSYAIEHRDIVKKFGRFPHRNKVLERQSTAEEIAFLNAGGFNP